MMKKNIDDIGILFILIIFSPIFRNIVNIVCDILQMVSYNINNQLIEASH